jgi:uncharacterized protein
MEQRTPTQDQITEFLKQKRIAIIGLSRKPSSFSKSVNEEFQKQQYETIPVNPKADEINGTKCYASVKKIEGGVDAAFIIMNTEHVDAALQDCIDAGIQHIWIHQGIKPNESLVNQAFEKNLNVITGYCPFMFLAGTQFPHNIHVFFLKLFGKYPK